MQKTWSTPFKHRVEYKMSAQNSFKFGGPTVDETRPLHGVYNICP